MDIHIHRAWHAAGQSPHMPSSQAVRLPGTHSAHNRRQKRCKEQVNGHKAQGSEDREGEAVEIYALHFRGALKNGN